MEDTSTEDFYNTIQGYLYEMDAPTDLIEKANIGAEDKTTNRIEELWMDGEDAHSVAMTLVDEYTPQP